MFNLTGKSALVTGAGSGIGESIAHALAEAGSTVFVTDINAEGAERVAGQIREAGGTAQPLVLDVSDTASCSAAVREVGATHDQLDILVNNAGIGTVGTILETTVEDLDRLYAVNVRGVFNVSKAFVPPMVAAGSGSVINLASIGGVLGIVDRLAYCTTKFAVVGLTKCMALDHATDGVRVNCICPGRVETPFVTARLKEYPDPEKAYREMCQSQAVGRMGRPEEIAAAALYLASDEAAFVTGACHIIDGGLSAG